MNTLFLNITRIFSLVLISSLSIAPLSGKAQSKFHAQTVNMLLTGTSTLHDWEMKSKEGQCDATITVNDNKVTLTSFSFSMPAESLKSEHTLMDKNTYKALNTDKNPNITLVLSSANVTPAGANTYQVKAVGKLTIAGTTKQTDVNATLKYNPATKSFTCTGTKSFKMSEYGVKPPTVMMGTIKTGDPITISYTLVIKS